MPDGSHKWTERLRRAGPAALLLIFWGLKTSSLWRHLGTRHYAMRGPLLDSLHMLWQSWWTALAVSSPDHSLLYSDLINHPSGSINALDYSLAFIHVGVAGLLRGAVGGIVAHNIVAIAGFSFSLVSIYLLLRELAPGRLSAAAMTCMVTAAGLCAVNELPDLELCFFGYFPLALLAWSRYLQHGSRRWLAAAIFLVGLTGFSQMYYGVALFTVLGLALLLALSPLHLPWGAGPSAARRTGLVLVGGLALAVLLHSRNISNIVGASAMLTPRGAFRPLWPYTLADLLFLALLFVGPALFAWRRRSRAGFSWALLALPLLLLSAGDAVDSGWGNIPLPLAWLRKFVPFFWRFTFSERLVTPMLLLTAASILVSLRGDANLRPGRRGLPGRAATLIALVLFWWGATSAPFSSMSCRSAEEPPGFSLSTHLPGGTPIKFLVEGAKGMESCADRRVGHFRRGAMGWLLAPLDTVTLPPVPPCIEALGEVPEDTAILELSLCTMNGYRAYFQTKHGKGIVGYPCRDFGPGALFSKPSDLSLYSKKYWEGHAGPLPTAEELGSAGVGYVVTYDMPLCLSVNGGGQRTFAPVEPKPGFTPSDFERTYGEPVCTDGITTVYGTSGS